MHVFMFLINFLEVSGDTTTPPFMQLKIADALYHLRYVSFVAIKLVPIIPFIMIEIIDFPEKDDYLKTNNLKFSANTIITLPFMQLKMVGALFD